MGLPFKIAWRYLFSKKSTNAINIISIISMVGMGIGALVLVVLLSVFNGFEDLVVELQSSFYADIEIQTTKGKVFKADENLLAEVASIEGVEIYSKVLEENAHLSFDGKSAIAIVRAYDSNFSKVNEIEEYILKGEALLSEDGQAYIILGAGVYFDLGASYTQPITMAIPKKGKTSAITAAQLFNTGRVIPSGVFGIQNEFDNAYVITDLQFLQSLQNYKDEVTAIEVKIKEGYTYDEVANALMAKLGADFITVTRVQQNQALYKAMQAEKFAMIAILFFVLLIISFTIVGALSMLAMEKKLDISILKTMGADSTFVFKVFLWQGMLSALIGAIVGVVIGVLIVGAQQVFGIIGLGGIEGGFVIDAYPVKLEYLDIIIAFAIVSIISFIASWLPASRAAKSKLQFVKY